MKMHHNKAQIKRWSLFSLGLLFLAVLVLFFCSESLQMRARLAAEYVKGVFNPVGTLKAANETDLPKSRIFAPFEAQTQQPETKSAQSAFTLPQNKQLTPPEFVLKRDIQGWNNCGPATLALALRMYGWKGDQNTIASVIKPKDLDKNVNIEELAEYASSAGLASTIRVAGDLDLIERLIAAGYPVIIEEGFTLEKSFWPGDDRWSSHFVLVTGYDRETGVLTTQDAYFGPNVEVDSYKLLADWKAFNYIYLVLYPKQDGKIIAGLLGDAWSQSAAFERAMQNALNQSKKNHEDLYAWFNLGSSYLGLSQYEDAWLAYNEARKIGLPQRMLRYQFGPFLAAYATGRAEDLKELVDYALKITSNSEEALYWQGKLYLVENQPILARKSFFDALSARPKYKDAIIALQNLK